MKSLASLKGNCFALLSFILIMLIAPHLKTFGQCVNVEINVTSGSWPEEVTWELFDNCGNLVTAGVAPDDFADCIEPGNYLLILRDSQGDGWNGAELSISVEGNLIETATMIAGWQYYYEEVLIQIGSAEFSLGNLISGNADGATNAVTGDIDGDGDLDVISTSFIDDKVSWYENDGTGNFLNEHVISTSENNPNSIYICDLDGDNDLDILIGNYLSDSILWFENDGDGNFPTSNLISNTSNGPYSVYASDLDGDNDLDVIVGSSSGNVVVWFMNLGEGEFTDEIVLSSNIDFVATAVLTIDLDGDDDEEVISTSFVGNKVYYYENLGGGNFSSEQGISSNVNWPNALAAADCDGDGDSDIISASLNPSRIVWHENDGTGNFFNEHDITLTSLGPGSVQSYDIDSDGDFDIFTASGGDNTISWYENNGFGQFSNERFISVSAEGASSIHCADIDADGDLDVLSASSDDDKIMWYENNGLVSCSQISGCTDPNSCNYNINASQDNGSCDPGPVGCNECSGETDGSGFIIGFPEVGESCDDGNTNTTNDTIQIDCQCEGVPLIAGCSDPLACNYLDTANEEDGSCIFPGCMDEQACNYDPSAGCSETCEYPQLYLNCDGTCINDLDEDGVCDEVEVAGCQDTSACNYDPNATDSDQGTCFFATAVYDCNGNCQEDSDNDGICDQNENSNGSQYCGEGTVWDPISFTCIEGEDCLGDLNDDGAINTNDLMLLLATYGGECAD